MFEIDIPSLLNAQKDTLEVCEMLVIPKRSTKYSTVHQTCVVVVIETTNEGTLEQLKFTRRPYHKTFETKYQLEKSCHM